MKMERCVYSVLNYDEFKIDEKGQATYLGKPITTAEKLQYIYYFTHGFDKKRVLNWLHSFHPRLARYFTLVEVVPGIYHVLYWNPITHEAIEIISSWTHLISSVETLAGYFNMTTPFSKNREF